MQTGGYGFTIKNQEICSLVMFLSDTLAAHQLGGFKVGVGLSFRKCRNCLATAEQMNEKVVINYIVIIIIISKNYINSFIIASFNVALLSCMIIIVLSYVEN